MWDIPLDPALQTWISPFTSGSSSGTPSTLSTLSFPGQCVCGLDKNCGPLIHSLELRKKFAFIPHNAASARFSLELMYHHCSTFDSSWMMENLSATCFESFSFVGKTEEPSCCLTRRQTPISCPALHSACYPCEQLQLQAQAWVWWFASVPL